MSAEQDEERRRKAAEKQAAEARATELARREAVRKAQEAYAKGGTPAPLVR